MSLFPAALALWLIAFHVTAGGSGLNYPDRNTVIEQLGLESHVEGGYFKRTFQADHREKIDQGSGPRFTMTSIFYLLTADSPVGHWHLNRSDIVHYYHLGAPLNYYLIHPDGTLETAVLGPDLAAGQQLQLTVTGGTWKASHLAHGDYGLISEAVSPGFDYEDMRLGDRATLLAAFPQHRSLIEAYAR
ncbi:cupin domain-containing protein [Seongchinamella unica]|uniref:Cupin domain-containing protein n=1 Tax=Seongchinamella unica TaxID=2547392 RepID=A0A4R5LXA5_9GAMM|nr:cupin domain-containing protein [Seongchinamella unica]TDG15918.1 cupin domain-containing protein [Seongchinamella unica]